RVELEEGDQDEGPFVHAGVGDREAGLVDLLFVVGEDIDVDHPGAPPLRAHPSHRSLDLEAGLEEVAWFQGRPNLDDRVEEIRLERADRLGLVHAGGPNDLHTIRFPEQSDGHLQVRQTIAEVGAQSQEGAAGVTCPAGLVHSEIVTSAETSPTPWDRAAPGLWTVAVT